MKSFSSKKFWPTAVALVVMSVGAYAHEAKAAAKGDPLDGVVGYDKMGGTQIAFSPVAADGSYTVTLSRLEGVAFTDKVGALTPTAGPYTDKPTQKSVWIYKIPDGSTAYAYGLGSQWGTMSKDVNELDTAKARASGTVNGGTVTFKFVKNADPAKACEMINTVVRTPGGMWGAHPSDSSPYVVPNVAGSPRTGWCVKGNTIVSVDAYNPAIRAALKAKP